MSDARGVRIFLYLTRNHLGMPGLKLPKQPDLLGQQSKEKRDGEKQRIHDSYDLAVSVVIGVEAAKTRTLAEPPNKQDSKELSSRRRREPGRGLLFRYANSTTVLNCTSF